jgi:hypothetical protein
MVTNITDETTVADLKEMGEIRYDFHEKKALYRANMDTQITSTYLSVAFHYQNEYKSLSEIKCLEQTNRQTQSPHSKYPLYCSI